MGEALRLLDELNLAVRVPEGGASDDARSRWADSMESEENPVVRARGARRYRGPDNVRPVRTAGAARNRKHVNTVMPIRRQVIGDEAPVLNLIG